MFTLSIQLDADVQYVAVASKIMCFNICIYTWIVYVSQYKCVLCVLIFYTWIFDIKIDISERPSFDSERKGNKQIMHMSRQIMFISE